MRAGESGSCPGWPVPSASAMARGDLHRGVSHVERGWRTHCQYKPSCDPLPAPTKRFPSLMRGRRWKSKVMTLHSTEQVGRKAAPSPRKSCATVTACPSEPSSVRGRGRGGRQTGHAEARGRCRDFCSVRRQRAGPCKRSSTGPRRLRQPLCGTPGEAVENPTAGGSSASLPGRAGTRRQVS